MKTQQSITALPMSPAEDRRRRMIRYTVAMSVRLLCVILCFVVQGWWVLVFAIGAVVLPYVAVVLANNKSGYQVMPVERPGTIVLARDPRFAEPRIADPLRPDPGIPGNEA